MVRASQAEGAVLMSEEDVEREHQLIETTKQQSMQEMVVFCCFFKQNTGILFVGSSNPVSFKSGMHCCKF